MGSIDGYVFTTIVLQHDLYVVVHCLCKQLLKLDVVGDNDDGLWFLNDLMEFMTTTEPAEKETSPGNYNV